MNFNFDFIGKRKIFYIFSTLILLIGLGSLVTQGLNLGIDFTGGTSFQISFEKSDIDVGDVRKVLSEKDHGKDQIQKLSDGSYQIKTKFMNQNEQEEYVKILSDELGKTSVDRTSAVGPTMGKEILQKGLIALFVAILLMVIYITVRFELRFAISGICALFHDVLIVLSLFSIFQWEVNSAFVAAILTIFGYSINDTIVIFDRIRENLGRVKRENLAETVNKSINATLRRSIFTSVSTLLPLFAVFLFGGETTRYFVLAIIIGMISGTYSSILNASPIWYDISMRTKKKRF